MEPENDCERPNDRRKQGGDFCSAIGCGNARYKKSCKGKAFFHFPKDKKRCEKWMEACRRDFTGLTAADLHKKGYKLCSDHFEPCMFSVPGQTRRLVWNAIPALFHLPGSPPKVEEVDLTAESVAGWMARQVWHAQAIAGMESPSPPFTMNEASLRHPAGEARANVDKKQAPENQKAARRKQDSGTEPHDPASWTVKTEPVSDVEEELPVFFGKTDGCRAERRDLLATGTVMVDEQTGVGIHQFINLFPSTQASQPEGPLPAVCPTTPPSSATTISSAHSDVGAGDQERAATITAEQQGAAASMEEQQRQMLYQTFLTQNQDYVYNMRNEAFSSRPNVLMPQKSLIRERNYVCEVCSRAFARVGHLKDHKLTHSGHKYHVCKTCNKTFARADSLKRHKVIHTGEKKHVCEFCNKAFFQFGDMKTHRSRHLEQKTHFCRACSQTFHQATDLKKHALVMHKQLKNHDCGFCGKTFHQTQERFDRHLLNHQRQKYTCRVCRKFFGSVEERANHLLTHAPTKNSTPTVHHP